MDFNDSQQFDSYVPIYDVVPEDWEDARPFLVEHLKKITTAVNDRVIGWLLEQQTLNGKRFIPSATQLSDGETNQQFRSVISKVIVFPGLTIGLNTQPHFIVINGNFTLIDLWGAATDAVGMVGEPIPNGTDTISYDATNIYITVAAAYTRAYAFIEYLQEL